MRRKSEKGQAMVEFALLLLPLLLILGGIIDFGWVFHQQVIANNASREAARYVSVYYNQTGYSDSDAKNKALQTIPDYLKTNYGIDGDDVLINKINSNTDVEASVSWETTTFMPFFSKLINIDINAVTKMKIEKSL